MHTPGRTPCKFKLPLFCCSAETGENIDTLYEEIVRLELEKSRDASIPLFKVVFLGDPGVGKTTLITHKTEDSELRVHFPSGHYPETIKLKVIESVSNADVAVIVCSVEDLEKVRESEKFEVPPNAFVIIAVNKVDLIAESSEKLSRITADLQHPFVCCSAKTGENVDALFEEIAKRAWETKHPIRKRVMRLSKATNRSIWTYKLVFLGDSFVGKNLLINSAIRQAIGRPQATLAGCSCHLEVEAPHSETVKFLIWDTAGQEKYQALVPMYTRDADAAVIVCSAIDKRSRERVGNWIRDSAIPENAVVFVALNTIDLCTEERVRELMEELLEFGRRVICCSAKTGENVEELFVELAMNVERNVAACTTEIIEDNERKCQINGNCC
jgi:small GTP-binding protein